MLDRQEIDTIATIFTKSISSVDTHQCHTTFCMIDPGGIEDDIQVLSHSFLTRLNAPMSSLQTIRLVVGSSEPLLGGL